MGKTREDIVEEKTESERPFLVPTSQHTREEEVNNVQRINI